MAKIGKPRGVARYASNGMLFIEGYRSISMAAKLMGLSEYQVSSACKDKHKEAGGYKWRYFAFSKPEPKQTKKPKATDAERAERMDDVLNRIAEKGSKSCVKY